MEVWGTSLDLIGKDIRQRALMDNGYDMISEVSLDAGRSLEPVLAFVSGRMDWRLSPAAKETSCQA